MTVSIARRRHLHQTSRYTTEGKVVRRIALIGALVLAGIIAPATAADAVTGYHVVVGSAGLNAHNGPGTGYAVVGSLSNGQAIDISCQTTGTPVGAGLPGTPTNIWDQLSNGWYITDYYTSTPGLNGSYTAGIPQCGSAPPPVLSPILIYNRAAAATWAINNYNNANGSRLYNSGDDCTYFVSQALWAGDLSMTADWTDNSYDINQLSSQLWIPGPTKAATDADIFKNYVVNSDIATIKEISWSDNTAGGAQLGDIIGYDWNGPADGILDHLAIVTSLNGQGYPSVSQHSPSQVNRYWSWSADRNNWIQSAYPGSRVYLIHIVK
jgi:uncharacterized protein YraI